MTKKRKLPCEIYPINDSMEDFEFPGDLDYHEILDSVESIISDARIGIPSYENPQYACITQSGEVLGVVTGGIAGDHAIQPDDGMPAYDYRFSVVVSPKGRRQGIARSLVKEITGHAKDYGDYSDSYIYLEAWVVNPHMADLLDSMGFEGGGSEWTPDDPMMGKYV